jgi:two-component system, chemotaxis family, protein-glutamate methylesterase/glutaminase
MQPRHLVVIGTSSGGLEALCKIVGNLPTDFPAAIAVVMHTSPQSPAILHDILARYSQLPSVSPSENEPLQAGTIYVAPPDFHLLIEPGRVRLAKGPKEHRFRPAVDPLFRSAAQVFKANTIGVVLTGNLNDGSAGLWAIKELGGVAIVQDPRDAMFPSMPKSALESVSVDYVAPLSDIPPLLVKVTSEPAREDPSLTWERLEDEVKIVKDQDPLEIGAQHLGEPSMFTCPECHGVLMQLMEGSYFRFRCHTGHAYSSESLLAHIQDQIEIQLWSTIRALQEGNMLMRTMADHVAKMHMRHDSTVLFERAAVLRQHANQLRQLVTSSPAPVHTDMA